MVRRILIALAALFICSNIIAQQKKEFHYHHLLSAMGTISPGIKVSDGAMTMSLHGYLEFFMDDYVSWRGDGFYFMGEQKKPAGLYQNSTLKWGPFYHFHKPNGKLDFYVGMQPGVNFVQPMGQDINGRDYYYKFKVVPAFSGVTGMNYHFGRIFNMFIEGTFIGSRYLGDGFTKINTSEVRISGGLGWQIISKKTCDCNK